jgi:preprotein translocase subunit SecA
MLKGLIGKVVGDPNEREIRKIQPMVDAINTLEPDVERRSEAELRMLTDRFRSRLASGETLDDLVPEAFAAIREVAKRTVDMRPFDVQLIGGIVLHRGMVAEMRTGEGKTLVATMPVYLNALSGRGVHLVTVNDYLARRDAQWMGPVYQLMGLTVGLLQSGAEQPAYILDPDYQREPYPGLRPVPRQEAYAADVTYGTNNEFGFDYLRDNIALTLERRVQRPLYYGIVDEVDNIFIDEARTPLIISGPSGESVEDYGRFAAIARKLNPEVHYELEEKERAVFLTDEGLALVEQETGIENIYDEANYRYVHYMQQALKAQVLFLEGRDYIRQRKQIILVDQHTGRLMPSRRLSEGLHQAIEAKEGVSIRPRDVTSATVTIQNYFRMYEKLAGMSGTALTEAEEFFKIYSLEVLAIPTNKPVVRLDHPDVVYRSEEAKLRAVAREILDAHSRGQPVLVGTTSVEMSERLGRRLTGERLQMAALSPRVAYALQDSELDREERAKLRETMNASLETMDTAAWRRMVRAVGQEPNALSANNLDWCANYLELGDEGAQRTMERAMRDGIAHSILNAKEHTREAAIIARAGQPGAVTIATNMAGRGVDIKLGGELSDEIMHRAHQVLRRRGLDPFEATPAQVDSAIAEVTPQYAKHRDQVLGAGGLHVLGTERHEARRIDNQLRGRSGRQGEPGSSRFYLSLEDDLMRRFGRKEMLAKLMEQIGDDFPIEHNLVSRTLERAQTSVEGYNFDIRKHLLEYDDVLNRQRETIYDERLRILQSDDLRPEVWRMLEGQVDEYLEKVGEDPEQQRLLFAGLDDVVPLLLPSPSAPFQGPLTFGTHLTAFPPFTISFLAERYADQPLEAVQQALHDLAQKAAAGNGEQIRNTVTEISQATQEKYEERLDRYRALLDEKIDDYMQLAEERGQMADPRRLAQHLERTYPLKLYTPREGGQLDLDNLRDHWLAQTEVEFHRQTCTGLMGRVQLRLPADIRLDRSRPAQIQVAKLADELRRVRGLARKQSRNDQARLRIEQFSLSSEPGPDQVLDFIDVVKQNSNLDFGRLDRLMGHVLGAVLHDLVAQYLDALEEDQVRLRRDLERVQASVVEGRKGGRASHLLAVLEELNELVHLDFSVLEETLSLAVAHEYDKWAQRQLAEIEADASRAGLSDTAWDAIAGHLLATHYTQKQAYDRGHRRRTSWMPRLPFGFVAQAYAQDLDLATLREQVLASLHWAVEQREQAWGQQELLRWEPLSLDDISVELYDGLLRYLGERDLEDLSDSAVEDLPPDLHNRLCFVLVLRQWDEGNVRLGDLAWADELLAQLGQELEDRILGTPLGELDDEMQSRMGEYLRQHGVLDDPDARERLLEQRVGDWDRRTREEVAGFLGQRFVESQKGQPISKLEPQARATTIDYLQEHLRFVDEERIQRFLVHQRVSDLPDEIQQQAILDLSRSRLDRLNRRKISNLDVTTRQAVIESLQGMGLFTDESRRAELADRTLSDLGPEVQTVFGSNLAHQSVGARSLSDLGQEVAADVSDRLKEKEALANSERVERLSSRRLDELDGDVASRIREGLLEQLRTDLADKTMEELPRETRRQIHDVLDERNYFVDQERVGWYERKTLAQLSSELLLGLEQHLGQIRMDTLGDTPFRDLPAETRESVLAFLDGERFLKDRADRLRLVQSGSLGELPDGVREATAQHLGRRWLVEIRNQRPPTLADEDRESVWVYLRAQGYFADEFKAELFAYQRLDEFDSDTRQVVQAALESEVIETLDSQVIGELPPDLQAEVRARLSKADYFVDEIRLQQAVELPVSELTGDVREAVEEALGEHLLTGLESVSIADLPAEIRDALWHYLDQVGYFVDEKKRGQLLDRRLVDLGNEVYERVVADLATYWQELVGDGLVSELDDALRQGLREALEALGYFESDAVREQVLGQPLGALRREDLEALSRQLGRTQLDAWADLRLRDLPEAEREPVLLHLQAQDWFVNDARLKELQGQPMRMLEGGVPEELRGMLGKQEVELLRRRRLADLDRRQLDVVYQVFQQEGLDAEEGQLRALRRQRLNELEPSIHRDLLRDLGGQVVDSWGGIRFQDLSEEQKAVLSGYLGRRIMGRIERRVLLHTISRLWIDYLTDIEDLRRGIGLEAYGQRDPLVEYKRRAFELFEELSDNIRRTVVRSLFRQPPEPLAAE